MCVYFHKYMRREQFSYYLSRCRDLQNCLHFYSFHFSYIWYSLLIYSLLYSRMCLHKKVRTFHMQGSHFSLAGSLKKCWHIVGPRASEKCGPMQVKFFLSALTINKACPAAPLWLTKNARWMLTLMDQQPENRVKRQAKPVFLGSECHSH